NRCKGTRMITARVSWTHQLQKFVPSGSLNKGQNYFRAGAVQIKSGSADRVEASVRGGGRQSVVLYLDLTHETLVASCTCSYYDDLNICKHIWATVLAADSKEHLKKLAEMSQPSIETELEHDEAAEDEYLRGSRGYSGDNRQPARPAAKAPQV